MKLTDLTPASRDGFMCMFNDLCIGSGYWLHLVPDFSITSTPDGDHKQYDINATHDGPMVITPDSLLASVHEHADWYAQHTYDYFARWGALAATNRFDLADYDAEVTDTLLQLCLFGRIVYG